MKFAQSKKLILKNYEFILEKILLKKEKDYSGDMTNTYRKIGNLSRITCGSWKIKE